MGSGLVLRKTDSSIHARTPKEDEQEKDNNKNAPIITIYMYKG